jgi:hypothetical protein
MIIILAGFLYFVDKNYLINKIIIALPKNTPIALGQVSILISDASGNNVYGFEMVDKSEFPIEKTIKAESAEINYDSDNQVINLLLINGTIKIKNFRSATEIASQDFDKITIPIELKAVKKKLQIINKQKDNLEFQG